MSNTLSPKQLLFVTEYMKDLNGQKSAERAGYALKSAHVTAYRLLKNDKVRKEIDAIRSKNKQDLIKKYDISRDKIAEELAAIAFSDIRDVATWGEYKNHLGEKQAFLTLKTPEELERRYSKVIKTIKIGKYGEISITLHDKLNALEQLGNTIGMFIGPRETDDAKRSDFELIKTAIENALNKPNKQ